MSIDHGSPSSDYGSEADQRAYLRSHGRQREQLLRQFVKLESGLGNSNAFRSGWVRAFGKHVCGMCGERYEWGDDAVAHVAQAHAPKPCRGCGQTPCRILQEWEPDDEGAWEAEPEPDCPGEMRIDGMHDL